MTQQSQKYDLQILAEEYVGQQRQYQEANHLQLFIVLPGASLLQGQEAKAQALVAARLWVPCGRVCSLHSHCQMKALKLCRRP